MTPAKKADRLLAIARALEKQAPEHPTHVEMGMRDLAARFRFNAILALGASDQTLMEAGHGAASEVLKIASREEFEEALHRRFCMRCMGIQIIGIEL